jgi:uncharacterized membrane protein YdjX (TVP38/TMEM64 family)
MRALRLLPLLLILATLVATVAFGLPGQLSWQTLAAQHAALAAAAQAHPAAAILAYTGFYALIVVLSIPATIVMSVAGGLLFGAFAGTLAAVGGATIGAVLLFLIVRGALRPLLAPRLRRLTERIGPGLERDGFNYLLALRVVPVFPFWLINLAPALVGMRLLPFAAATLFGIVPASAIYVSIGAGLGGVLDSGHPPDLGAVLSPRVLAPLVALGLLSLLPVAWRRWRTGFHA